MCFVHLCVLASSGLMKLGTNWILKSFFNSHWKSKSALEDINQNFEISPTCVTKFLTGDCVWKHLRANKIRDPRMHVAIILS